MLRWTSASDTCGAVRRHPVSIRSVSAIASNLALPNLVCLKNYYVRKQLFIELTTRPRKVDSTGAKSKSPFQQRHVRRRRRLSGKDFGTDQLQGLRSNYRYRLGPQNLTSQRHQHGAAPRCRRLAQIRKISRPDSHRSRRKSCPRNCASAQAVDRFFQDLRSQRSRHPS